MELKTLLEIIKKRRSTRGFTEMEITDQQVKAMVDAARFAPCGANSQPWEFVFIRDRENIKTIMDVLEDTRKEYQKRHPEIRGSPKNFQRDASAMVAVLGDPRCDPRLGLKEVLKYPDSRDYEWSEYMLFLGMGAAIENLLLAATAMGIGSVWLTSDLISFEDGLKRLLGVPEQIRLVSLLVLGKPSKEFPTPFKREVEDILHMERYDTGKMRSDEEIISRHPKPKKN